MDLKSKALRAEKSDGIGKTARKKKRAEEGKKSRKH